MLIPYRAKNPVKRFPIATVSIIALNVIVYLFALICWNTTKDAARTREYVAELERRFPYGEMVAYGNALLRKLG